MSTFDQMLTDAMAEPDAVVVAFPRIKLWQVLIPLGLALSACINWHSDYRRIHHLHGWAGVDTAFVAMLVLLAIAFVTLWRRATRDDIEIGRVAVVVSSRGIFNRTSPGAKEFIPWSNVRGTSIWDASPRSLVVLLNDVNSVMAKYTGAFLAQRQAYLDHGMLSPIVIPELAAIPMEELASIIDARVESYRNSPGESA